MAQSKDSQTTDGCTFKPTILKKKFNGKNTDASQA